MISLGSYLQYLQVTKQTGCVCSEKRSFFDGGVGRDGIPVAAMVAEHCRELYIIKAISAA
ncbi:hypothetical protein GH141_00450 [bacterium]|nr:hypothetical protein [bacterium]